jgi:hypothetical protein
MSVTRSVQIPTSAYSQLRQTCHSTPKMGETKGVKMVYTNNLVFETVYISVHDDTGTGTSKSILYKILVLTQYLTWG